MHHKHEPRYDHAGYLEKAICMHELPQTVDKCVVALKKLEADGVEIDSIAVTGTSGLLVGPTVALLADKTLIVVRKDYNCHSINLVEGDRGARTYVIIDDFVAEGGTSKRVVEQIKLWAPEAKCAGVLQYHYMIWLNEEHTKVSGGCLTPVFGLTNIEGK
jgi:adenine/guanine phosphoribosyltransferase-like PRPP-binding protein